MSDSAESTLETNELGYLLAATDNDAYNALACTRFAGEFGRNAVFQLPMPEEDQKDTTRFISGLRGQVAFSTEAEYEELLRRYFQGWRFQKTRLTDQYRFTDYLRDYGENNLARLIVRPSGALLLDHDATANPQSGDTVVSFLPTGNKD